MALWLYGFMALWLYGFMALSGRLKYIFIVSKQRLIQIFRRKRNYFVQINFAEKNYLFSTASGNSLRRGYKAIAGGGNLALLCSVFALAMLPQAVIFRSGAKSGRKKINNFLNNLKVLK